MEMLGLFPVFYTFPNLVLPGLWVSRARYISLRRIRLPGAGFAFAFLARKAYKEDRPEIYGYMKKYGMFLLIFSYVIGSITDAFGIRRRRLKP